MATESSYVMAFLLLSLNKITSVSLNITENLTSDTSYGARLIDYGYCSPVAAFYSSKDATLLKAIVVDAGFQKT